MICLNGVFYYYNEINNVISNSVLVRAKQIFCLQVFENILVTKKSITVTE